MGDYTEHLISMAGGDGEPDALDLDAIQARVDAAALGPWEWSRLGPRHELSTPDGGIFQCATMLYPDQPDADFIAHARTDVPALLALVREQQARLDLIANQANAAEMLCLMNGAAPELAVIPAGAIRAALTATEGQA